MSLMIPSDSASPSERIAPADAEQPTAEALEAGVAEVERVERMAGKARGWFEKQRATLNGMVREDRARRPMDVGQVSETTPRVWRPV